MTPFHFCCYDDLMSEDPFSLHNLELTPLKKTLRIKISIIFVFLGGLLAVIISLINLIWLRSEEGSQVVSLVYYLEAVVLPILILSLSLVAASVFLVLRYLKPLEVLYQGAQILAKGELDHRISIHTGDEIEFISYSLNSLAQNLSENLNKDAQSREYILAEKNKLDTIISSISDGVIVLDLHHNIVLANRAASRITGYEIPEMLRQPVESLITLKNASGQAIDLKKCFLDYADPAGAPQLKIITSLVGKNQQTTQVKATVTPIIENIQADLSFIMTLHDVTPDQVFQQMQIDFVSMASHEIRTPLTSIINYLSVLAEDSSIQLDSEAQEFIKRALTSARQLTILVDNLLNVSKIERNTFSVSLNPMDWLKNLEHVVESSRAQAVQKNISLELKLPSQSIPPVMADEIRINEVLNNLISNAISYTQEGGHIVISCKIIGEEIVTYVRDTGAGIPIEAIPHLFTKFFRVAGSLDRGSKGTGLGLYISKSIIDLHHGKIWVDSEVGKGSTFYFSLPLLQHAYQTPTIVQLNSPSTAQFD